MKDKLDSQDFYEVMQQYRHSNMDNQEAVVKAFENVKTWIRENLLGNVQVNEENENVPEWLTPEVRKTVKNTWDSHKDTDDHLRVKAVKIVQETALNSGYKISISKAMELMKEFCNIYN
ncbi:MAG: hypothetical protein M0R03_15540 [Novosphingobium sp.]|nr:hypothetical protein [Novosphingobium sp.]